MVKDDAADISSKTENDLIPPTAFPLHSLLASSSSRRGRVVGFRAPVCRAYYGPDCDLITWPLPCAPTPHPTPTYILFWTGKAEPALQGGSWKRTILLEITEMTQDERVHCRPTSSPITYADPQTPQSLNWRACILFSTRQLHDMPLFQQVHFYYLFIHVHFIWKAEG